MHLEQLVAPLAMGLLGLARRGLVLQRLDNGIVGRVLLEVLKPQQSVTLTFEHIGNPAEGVIEVPEGDTNAGIDLDAGTNGLPQLLVTEADEARNRYERGGGD